VLEQAAAPPIAMAEVTADLERRLRARFQPPAYAWLPQVGDSTGLVRRHADAIVMGLWPSRGLTLMGFEIKAGRGDWLRELRDPRKAEEIAAFCDEWWIVAPQDAIVPRTRRVRARQAPLDLAVERVEEPELCLEHLNASVFPAGWGLMVPQGQDGLRVVKQAERLDAKPPDRAFLAAILRRAAEHVVPKTEIEAELKAAHERGFAAGRADTARQVEWAQQDGEQLRQDVAAFQEASGITITAYHGARLGAVVGHLERMRRHGGLRPRLKGTRDHMAEVVASVDELLAGGELEGL
jgi:hypothetical protein